jgi:membrane protein YqaA with SNARE-associated domain
LLKNGQRAHAIWFLSGLCVLDGMLPMVPAEFMALALMILQPQRLILVATVFAISAAVSAGLLATLVASLAQATSWLGWLDSERQGPGWAQSVAWIQSWGAPAIGLAAIFPDSPRTSIAAAALAGLEPIRITIFVLAGKALLYGMLALAVRYMPSRWPRRGNAFWQRLRLVQRPMQRLIALRRWVNQRAGKDSINGGTR